MAKRNVKPLRVMVMVYATERGFVNGTAPFLRYMMNHSDEKQRRRLGQSCADAFRAGQVVVTIPVASVAKR